MVLFILVESAMGYVLLKRNDADAIVKNTKSVAASVTDYGLFGKMVSFVSFAPFKSPEHGLDNINSISEGICHEYLAHFLEMHIAGQKGAQLGVVDARIASSIQEHLDVKCVVDDQVLMLIRGGKMHIHRFLKDVKQADVHKAQLGLGHAYSRAKIKFNVNKADNMIIQSVSLVDQLDKDLNTFSMRLREWYSWHFPELNKLVKDNYEYARIVELIKDKSTISEGVKDALTEIVHDDSVSEEIFNAAKTSMGIDLGEFDLLNIDSFVKKVISLTDYRKSLGEYLNEKMHSVAPNLTSILGEVVGARLVSHAGSLINLAKQPASTVQILGAEKALFRALKTRGKTPKYGLLFNSSFIGKASKKNKGRVARYLANKCAMAVRLDAFQDTPTSKFGEKFRQQIEERVAYYESGQKKSIKLQKNLDAVREAQKEVAKETASSAPAPVTAATPSKKRKHEEIAPKKAEKEMDSDDEHVDQEAETPKKKSRKSEGADKKKKEKTKTPKKEKKEVDEDGDASMVETPVKKQKVEAEAPKSEKKKEKTKTPKKDKKAEKEEEEVKAPVETPKKKEEDKKAAKTPKSEKKEKKEDKLKTPKSEKKEKKAKTPKSEKKDKKRKSTAADSDDE